MREIVFDTETTGLSFGEDRVIEIGAVELVNRFSTGRTFHVYINPEGRRVHADALAVHGISDQHLAEKPVFAAIADEFLAFIDGAKLVAHNASFDMAFLNAELVRLGLPELPADRFVDTLAIARRKHPMGPNSLDALCKRYGVDNSHRTRHGALLDSGLLADVYIELLGGKQAAFGLEVAAGPDRRNDDQPIFLPTVGRPAPLRPRVTLAEQDAHAALVRGLGEKALWLKPEFSPAPLLAQLSEEAVA